MDADPKTVVDADPKPDLTITMTQDELDKKFGERLARERAKFADYDEIKKKAETLEAEKKKREELELSELDKAKKRQEELEEQLNIHKKDTDWRKSWEESEAARIEKEMEELTDRQKDLINSLPLEKRSEAISEFKSDTPGSPDGSKGTVKEKLENASHDELANIKLKYGSLSAQYREALKAKMIKTR